MGNRADRRARALSKGVILDPSGGMRGSFQVQAPPEPVRIALGYCYNERSGVSGLWHQSILKLLGASLGRYAYRPIPVETGPFLSKARNYIVDRFLQNEDPYLLMTDTDTVFEPRDVDLLLEADASIAGALYYTAAAGMEPWATALVEGEDGDLKPVSLPEPPQPPAVAGYGDTEEESARFLVDLADYETEIALPEYGPRPVAAVGMGLTLIKREVVVDVKSTYEHPFEYLGHLGEDVAFCLRAGEFQHETVLVPKARIGHVKAVVL